MKHSQKSDQQGKEPKHQADTTSCKLHGTNSPNTLSLIDKETSTGIALGEKYGEAEVVRQLNTERGQKFLRDFVRDNVPRSRVERWCYMESLDKCYEDGVPVPVFDGVDASTSHREPRHPSLDKVATHLSKNVINAHEYRIYYRSTDAAAGSTTLLLDVDRCALHTPRAVTFNHHTSIAARAAQTNAPILIDDIQMEMEMTVTPRIMGTMVRSIIAVPLSHNGLVGGVIELIRYVQLDKGFSKKDLDLAAIHLTAAYKALAVIWQKQDYRPIKMVNARARKVLSEMEADDSGWGSDTIPRNVLTEMCSVALSVTGATHGMVYTRSSRSKHFNILAEINSDGDIVEDSTDDAEVITLKDEEREMTDGEDKYIVQELVSGGTIARRSYVYANDAGNKLAVPIIGDSHRVISVIVLQRDSSGSIQSFTRIHEQALTLYTTYITLALTLHKQQSQVRTEQAFSDLYKDIMSYYCAEREPIVRQLQDNWKLTEERVPPGFYTYNWYYKGYEHMLPQLFIHMVRTLFTLDRFDVPTLCRFTATVRKNYRPVTYHNYYHGMVVAHCVFVFLNNNRDAFTESERLGLLFGAYCHDLDHRGFNNSFISKYDTPIGNLYSSSVMERYHWHITQLIMIMPGCEPFNHFSHEDKLATLHYMEHAIISTDLFLFFNNQKKLSDWIESGEIDCVGNERHKATYRAVLMNGCDLCASAKPWKTQVESVTQLYDEFYEQGDLERQRGDQPIPMMDREQRASIPQQQVGFLMFVCLKCYQTLAKVYPEIQPLVDGIQENLAMWDQVRVVHEKRARKDAREAESRAAAAAGSKTSDGKGKRGKQVSGSRRQRVRGGEAASEGDTITVSTSKAAVNTSKTQANTSSSS